MMGRARGLDTSDVTMTYEAYRTARWLAYGKPTTKETPRISSWGKPMGPRHLDGIKQSTLKLRRVQNLTRAMATTSVYAETRRQTHMASTSGGDIIVRRRTEVVSASGKQQQCVATGKSPINGVNMKSAPKNRPSVDSQSVILKSRYDGRSHPGGVTGPVCPPSHPRPLGKTRVVCDQEADDVPTLTPEVDNAPPEVGRRAVRRRGTGAGVRAVRGGVGGGCVGGGGKAQEEGGRPREYLQVGGEIGNVSKNTKTTTTNRNQCVYVERVLSSDAVPMGVVGGGGVDSVHNHHQQNHNGHPLGAAQGRQTATIPKSAETRSPLAGKISSEGPVRLPRVAANGNQSSTPSATDSAVSSSSSHGGLSSQSLNSCRAIRERDFVKKLHLLKQRPKTIACDAQSSSSTETCRSVNLPMWIKVHLPATSTAKQSRDLLLLEKVRRDIREVVQDGNTGPESNCSMYPLPADSFAGAGTTQAAKLTPVLFPPVLALDSPEVYYSDSQPKEADEAARVVGRQQEDLAMVPQQCSEVVSGPTVASPPSTASAALISTHRIPLKLRTQSAHPGHSRNSITNNRGPLHLGVNLPQPASPRECGYQMSRPSSALSMCGMPRSGNSSISDNPTTSETDMPDKDSEQCAMWPSLIDVQRLKIGGFRYKKKHATPCGDRQQRQYQSDSNDHNAVISPGIVVSNQDSLEAKKKTILNFGTIIVPSHTCVDCPLCNLYFAKEDLWPPGPPPQAIPQPAQHPDGGPTLKNVNNNNSRKIVIGLSPARRAKLSHSCKNGTSNSMLNESRDRPDLTMATPRTSKSHDVPNSRRCTREPEAARPRPRATDANGFGATTKPEVPKPEVRGRPARRPSSALVSRVLLIRRPRSAAPAALAPAPTGNQLKDPNSKDGVSVTVRIPHSQTVEHKQKARYDQSVNRRTGEVTFRFSYVKVRPADLVGVCEKKT